MRATRKQVEGERKPVTILFADIVGSTAKAEMMDPEDWSEIITGAHQRVANAVYLYEGTVAQLLGDGVLAFFGAPIAHEDDPIRATLAALELQNSIVTYSQELSEQLDDFQMRVGIHSGTVVIGDIGTDLHVEYLAIGDTVNLAARLQSAADPGTIMVSEETQKRFGPDIETLDMGSIEVKGKSEPLHVYRVLSAKRGVREMRGVPGLQSPLIGREKELKVLGEMVENLRAGKGGVVTIVGEAGIGKTRLIADLQTSIVRGDLKWVEGGCLSYGGSTPYHLWIDVLHGLFGLNTISNPSEELDQIRHILKDLCPDRLDIIYPFLGNLLSLPMDEEAQARIRDLEGESLKTATFQAIESLVECIARDHPLILVCEDIHWSDATSLELLEKLLNFPSRISILIICVLRPEKDHSAWVLREKASSLAPGRYKDLLLDPLPDFESENLVDHLLSESEGMTALKKRILAHAEGNPFYVEEILRSLIDMDVLIKQGDDGTWKMTEEFLEIPIPDTLHGVLLARMDRLPEDVRRILQMASVIGRRFESALLDRIVPFPEQVREACLSTLEGKEFIRYLRDNGGKAYIFKHALTQEVAYETLLRRNRRDLHGQVGEAIEMLHADALKEHVERLADHFFLGAVWEKAWTYNTWAGRKAKERFANQEAIDFFESSCQVTEHLPDLDPYHLAEVHLQIAEILSGINQYDQALIALKQGQDLIPIDEHSDRNHVMRARIYQREGQVLRSKGNYEGAIASIQMGIDQLGEDHIKERGALKIALASASTRQGELETASHWCEAGIKEVEAGGDLAELAHAYSLLGTIRRDLGDTAASLACRQRSLGISQTIDNLPLQMEAHNNLAVAHYDLGQLEKAVTHYEQSRELSEHIGNRNTAARAEVNLGEVFLIQGEWDLAESAFRNALTIWEHTGYALGQAYGCSNMGAVLTRKDQPQEALSYLQRSEDAFQELGARGFLTVVHRRKAAAYMALRDIEKAEELAQRSLDLARDLSMAQEEGAALRRLGVIYREKGELDQATDELLKSADIFREAGIQYEEARALFELARVWNDSADFERSSSAIERTIDIFQTLGAKVDLQSAQDFRTTIKQ